MAINQGSHSAMPTAATESANAIRTGHQLWGVEAQFPRAVD